MHRFGTHCTPARLARVTGFLAVSLALTLPAAPAGAVTPERTAAAATAAPQQVRAVITFRKNPAHPFRSRVIWSAYRQRADHTWRLLERADWRAGSGFGGPHTTDECVRGRGWLPDGRYSFVQYDDYWGNLIKGRAFFLGNKACRNGTQRTELFIHTETGAGNRQCANRPGDQICRWEWPRVNDYRSAGCIKMSPHDLAALTRHYHRWFRPGVRYPMSRVRVRVTH